MKQREVDARISVPFTGYPGEYSAVRVKLNTAQASMALAIRGNVIIVRALVDYHPRSATAKAYSRYASFNLPVFIRSAVSADRALVKKQDLT
jgi:hypothetical protein